MAPSSIVINCIVIESRHRSRRWTLRRLRSARRGARITRRVLALLPQRPPKPDVLSADVFDPLIVATTFIGLLLAPNLVRPWKVSVISVAGHPVESIGSIYSDDERLV